jgi:hypothetical protein
MLEPDNDISIRWLMKSLVRGVIDGLRRNRLAAVLAALTLTGLIAFGVYSRYDGLRQYQNDILPRLLRLETAFNNSLGTAWNASGEWRAYYFKDAHSRVRDILRAAELERPQGYSARRKHRQFIRYYEAIDEAFHRLEMQMAANPNFDYLSQLTGKMDELKPVRDAWATWANQNILF